MIIILFFVVNFDTKKFCLEQNFGALKKEGDPARD